MTSKTPIGQIYNDESGNYMLCEKLTSSGKCEGRLLMKTSNVSKKAIIDCTLDLINQYGEQKALVDLLDKLTATQGFGKVPLKSPSNDGGSKPRSCCT